MMYHEFIEKTGLQVTEEEFAEINDIYMNCGFGIDNPTFCNYYNKPVNNNPIVRGLYYEVKKYQRMYRLMSEAYFNLAEFGYETEDSRESASLALCGEKNYIKEKLIRGIEMNVADISWLKENL